MDGYSYSHTDFQRTKMALFIKLKLKVIQKYQAKNHSHL